MRWMPEEMTFVEPLQACLMPIGIRRRCRGRC